MTNKRKPISGAAATPKFAHALRPLTPDDLDRVVEIDRAHSGRPRDGFFQKRLRAALREPDAFVYLGATAEGRLVGFAFARLLSGEFGTDRTVAILDAIAIEPGRQGTGLGRLLLDGMDEVLRHKNVGEIRSQLDWNNHALVRFLDGAGFRLAPRIVLARHTEGAPF